MTRPVRSVASMTGLSPPPACPLLPLPSCARKIVAACLPAATKTVTPVVTVFLAAGVATGAATPVATPVASGRPRHLRHLRHRRQMFPRRCGWAALPTAERTGSTVTQGTKAFTIAPRLPTLWACRGLGWNTHKATESPVRLSACSQTLTKRGSSLTFAFPV